MRYINITNALILMAACTLGVGIGYLSPHHGYIISLMISWLTGAVMGFMGYPVINTTNKRKD